MNVVLWIVQVVLGTGFLYSGWLKTFGYEAAQSTWAWVNDVPQGLVFFIGIMEWLGALGLILPMLFKVKPILTPIAAVALLGGIFHILRDESDIVINIIFMGLALFIAWGRFRAMARPRNSNVAK